MFLYLRFKHLLLNPRGVYIRQYYTPGLYIYVNTIYIRFLHRSQWYIEDVYIKINTSFSMLYIHVNTSEIYIQFKCIFTLQMYTKMYTHTSRRHTQNVCVYTYTKVVYIDVCVHVTCTQEIIEIMVESWGG